MLHDAHSDLGSQADGAASIWNIASYHGRGKESPGRSQLAIQFSVSEVTHYTSTHDSLARIGLMVQLYHRRIRTCNPKMAQGEELFAEE